MFFTVVKLQQFCINPSYIRPLSYDFRLLGGLTYHLLLGRNTGYELCFFLYLCNGHLSFQNAQKLGQLQIWRVKPK